MIPSLAISGQLYSDMYTTRMPGNSACKHSPFSLGVKRVVLVRYVRIQGNVSSNRRTIANRGVVPCYIVIVLPGGHQVDAPLLSASPRRLRALVRGQADTAEFQLSEGQWTSESGGCVELGATLAEDSADAARLLANALPLVLSAG